jgi:MFS family permease
VAGTSLLPVTVLMLLFSSRVGALAQRFGPRFFMTVGPLLAAGGVLLVRGIGPDASYVFDVLPGAVVFGAGLTLTVAPLTATVLSSAPDRNAGVASGVNNAVARAAGLLAVAVIPVAAGISGEDYTEPTAFAAGFRTATLLCAAVLAAGGVLALLTVRRPLEETPSSGTDRAAGPAVADGDLVHVERFAQCDVSSPQLHPPQHRH